MEIRPASYPIITNILLVEANTEYKHTLDSRIQRFTVRARENVPFHLSFQQGQSGTNYLHIQSSEVWTEEEVYADVTLYMQSPNGGTTIEILEWVRK